MSETALGIANAPAATANAANVEQTAMHVAAAEMRHFRETNRTHGESMNERIRAAITGEIAEAKTDKNSASRRNSKYTNAPIAISPTQVSAPAKTFFWKAVNICKK